MLVVLDGPARIFQFSVFNAQVGVVDGDLRMYAVGIELPKELKRPLVGIDGLLVVGRISVGNA